tara:strand:+ start:624 stop:1082 length:459 start_codon:yes stop_codon:yes gene_type:complete
MGILGKIFGTDKAIESGLNMIYKAGDALFYTDQEKAADKENKIKQVHQFMNDWMETTKGQNIARRLLAVMITTVWLFLYLVGILLSVIAPWVATEISIKLMESAKVLESNAEMMSGAVMLILAFYFAAPHMDKIVEGALNKFGGNKDNIKKP